MSIARHTLEEDDKLRLLEKEKRQFHVEQKYYFWWLVFLIGVFVLSVIAIVVYKN